jgi:hypothetical protein
MTKAEMQKKAKWMETYDVIFGEDVETPTETDFSKFLSSSQNKNFQEGEVFQGKVISIGPDFVTVDIGYKL